MRRLLDPDRPGARLDLGGEPSSTGAPVQLALDELGVPLHEVTFVVVDLETTGGSPSGDQITEIGAVKVRGGEVIGEFGTLVNPGRPIPPTITVLTGITTAMVMTAPSIGEVLPAFLEFARGSVLVAHNARFDVGFLKANAARMELAWPRPTVVDTVQLARRVVTRDEAPNHRLASLARLFGAATMPNHRALQDARATVDVLHGLLARMASLGVAHLEDLATAADPVPPARRRRSTLADHLPRSPASTSSSARARRSSTSAPRPICAAASGSTSPPRRPDGGSARWSISRSRCGASRARRGWRRRCASCG